MKKEEIRIVFAGGGTGGHIYPGIAVSDAVKTLFEKQNKNVSIYWIGNKSGMDCEIVEKNTVSVGGSITAFYGIPCGKLRRYFSLHNFVDIFKIFAGFIKSVVLLKKIKPNYLFSKGGFVSVPPCWAAKLLGIPYFTHECDFTPGLATKLNAGGAKKVLVSYKETINCFSKNLQKKCEVTGNPVRPVFYSDNSALGKKFLNIPENHSELVKPILLILGGSLGAKQLNELVKENFSWLTERFIVVHQTGKTFAEENPLIMNTVSDSYKPYPFIYKEMASVIQAADVVLSRSGANSIWECAVCAKPMVLVPLCGSGTRGDQVDNAKFFEKHGAAKVLIGNDVDSEHLKQALEPMTELKTRQMFSDSCKKLCEGIKPAEKIAEVIFMEQNV